jgi:hypothetical protein
MSNIGIALFTLWSLIALGLYVTNRDLFSPAKLLHVQALVFCLSLYIGPEMTTVYLMYFCILLLTCVFGLWEALNNLNGVARSWTINPPMDAGRARFLCLVLWLLTAIPVLAQVYMFSLFGGIAGYLGHLLFRVRDFSGLGPITTTIKTLPVLNLVYFGILLVRVKPGLISWGMFCALLFLTIAIGLLSGSRGGTLMNLLLMGVIYNYIRKPVRASSFALLGIALMSAGLFLGIARNKVNYVDFFETGQVGNRLSASLGKDLRSEIRDDGSFNTGLYGIRLVLEQGVPDPKFGETFLTAITNMIPRDIWPDKPRTGGVVLTEEYTGNEWFGLSNLSTGIYPESMLNFGIIGGLVFGTIFYSAIFAAVLKVYVGIMKMRTNRNTLVLVGKVIAYTYFVQMFAALLVSEFTNDVVAFILQLVVLALILFVINIAEVHRPSNYHPLAAA